MFEGILEKFLQSKLGKYVEGIDKQNLSIGVWGGNILLENLLIKPNLFEQNGLPLRLKFGKIKKLSMKVPWTRLSSAPVELVLETLYLVVVPKSAEEWEIKDTWSFEYKKRILEEFAQIMAANLKLQLSQKQDQKEDGYVDRLVTKIVDNLQLTIQNIHIRYEDSISMPNKFFSLGITLRELSINTTNSNWNNTYYDRLQSDNKDKPLYKRLKIDGLAIYLHVDDPVRLSLISSKSIQQNQNQGKKEVSQIDIDNLVENRLREMFSRQDQMIEGINYLILPIELEVRLTQLTKIEIDKPMFNLEINLNELGLELYKSQYEAIFKMIDFVQNYSKFSSQGSTVKKYKFIRPIYPIQYQQTKSLSLLDRKLTKKLLDKSSQKSISQIPNKASYSTLNQPALINDQEDEDEFYDALDEQLQNDSNSIPSQETQISEIDHQEESKQIDSNSKNNNNAVEWWKYAIRCVLKDIKFKKGSWTEFKLTKWRRKQYGRQLIYLARKCINDDFVIQNEILSEEEQFLFNHIVQANDLQDLQNWIGIVIKKKIEKHQKQKDQDQQQDSGILSYFFSWGVKKELQKQKEEVIEESKDEINEDDDFTLNDEEIDEIKASIKSSLADLPQFSLNDLNLTEEQKNKLVKLQVYCNFQRGKINLIENNQIVEIFQQDLIVELKTLRDQSFDATIKNRNAGLFVKERQKDGQENKKHLVRKLEDKKLQQEESKENFDEENYLWILNMSKDNSSLDDLMNINFESSPILITYDAIGLNSISEFFKADYTEDIRAKALDKFSEIKDQTQISVQDLLQKKQNNFTIKIASPMIEIPFKAHNSEFVGEPEELRDRTWIVNLGNILFKNMNSNEKIDEYERFYLKIYEMSLQYLKHDHRAQVLEEVTLELDVAVKNDLKAAILKRASEVQEGGVNFYMTSPEVLVNAKLPALQLNMSPDIFNGLVNISEVLKSHGVEEDLRQLKDSKDKILNESLFNGLIYTRGVRGYNNYWTQQFAVVSGNYLYFYKSKRELMPYHYLSLREIQIENQILPNDIQSFDLQLAELINILQAKGKNGEKVFLKFQDKVLKDEFKAQVVLRQKDLLISQQGQQNVKVISDIIHKDPNQVGLKLDFQVGNIELRVYNQTDFVPLNKQQIQESESSQWLLARVQNLNLSLIKFTYEIKIQVDLSSLNIRETQLLNKDLIRNEAGKNLLEIQIDVFDIYSPNIEDSEIIIIVNLGKMFMLFEPITINQAVKFFRNVKSSRKQDLESLQHNLMNEGNQENEEKQVQSCNQIKFLLIKAIIKASGLSIMSAHHIYHTPVLEMSLGESSFDYYMFYDHDIIEGRFKDCQVFDLTNYPRTIIPQEGQKADLDLRNLYQRREIIGTRENIESLSNEIYFKTSLYTIDCPKRLPDKMSILDLDISQVKILYVYEMAFRIQDYFFDKFLWAVTDTDPYLQTDTLQKQVSQIQGFDQVDSDSIMNFDLKQTRNDMLMNIKIHRPYVILKDRPYSESMLEIDLGEISIQTDEYSEDKRFVNAPEKMVLLTRYLIKASDLGIVYKNKENEEFQVTEPFDLNLEFSMLNSSPYLGLINSHDLDKSYKVIIDLLPVFQLKITQEVYTYLLKCADLNLAFTDYLEDQFYFKNDEEYFRSTDYIKKTQIIIKSSFLQITTYENQKILTQLALKSPNITIDAFLNKRYNYDISFEHISSFFLSEDSKQLLFGKLTQVHRIMPEEDPLDIIQNYENDQEEQGNQSKQLQVLIQMYPNGAKEFIIQINKLKLFVYPYFYLMLFNFFTEGMPQYEEDSFDKPNEFNADFEELPEMKMTVNFKETLLCFAPENQQPDKTYKAIACQAFVEYEFKREKIRRVKTQIWNQIKEAGSLEQLGAKPIQLPISWMRLQGSEVCPFICDLSDLEMFKFDEINKRQVISPFNVSYFYARYLQFRPHDFKLLNFEKSEIKMDMIMLKISYYDVRLLFELFNEFNGSFERFNEYFKLHSRQKQNNSRLKSMEEHKQNQKDRQKKKISQVADENQIDGEEESSALKTTQKAIEMLTSLGRKNTIKHKRDDHLRQNRLNLIEEEKENSGQKQRFSSQKITPKDPDNFIEDLIVDYDKIDQKLNRVQSSGIQVVVINDQNNTFYPVLSLNIYSFLYKMQEELEKRVGDTQLKGMVSYYNSIAGEWEPLIEKIRIQYLSDSYKDQNFILLSFRNDLNINITTQLMQIVIQTYLQLQEQDKEEKNQMNNVINRERELSSRQSQNFAINNSFISSSSSVLVQKKNQDGSQKQQQNENKVTPYTIVNHCAKNIKISRVFQQELQQKNKNSKIPKTYELKPGETVDYEVDYEEEAKQLMTISRDELVRKQDYINVVFNEGESILKNINLGEINHYHHEFNNSNKLNENYVGYGVKFDNMKKVFMIRSPYVMNNMTDQEYQLQILKEMGKDPNGKPILQQVKILTLKPMQCFPIAFEDMNLRFSLSCERSPNQWSNPINFKTIIEKVPKNKTTYLYHGKQFSVITKVKSEFKKCYNINIKTPVVIKNALPCNLRIKSDQILNQKHRVNKTKDRMETYYEYEPKDFYLSKGQSLQLYNHNLSDLVHFKFNLDSDQTPQSGEFPIINSCFQWAEANIKNDEFKQEKIFLIKDAENNQSSLEVVAKMSTTKNAGVQITLYVRNVIINNTDQRLTIYYDKKMAAAGQLQSQDNSVILVSNVIFNVIVNFQFQKERVLASIQLPDGAKSFSDPFYIDVAAVTNQISIRKSKYSFFDFKIKTQLSLACSEEEIYTKVTTISPCFVFLNKTKRTILVRQDDQQDDVQILLSGQRIPFFYNDSRKAELISLKCVEREGAEFDDGSHDWTFKFSIKEVGRITILNRSTKDLSLSKFLLIEKDLQEQNQIMFVTFSEEDKKFPTYKIENRSKVVQVKYHQKDHPHHEDIIRPSETKTFSWTNPFAEQSITCCFFNSLIQDLKNRKEFDRRDIQADDLNLRMQIPLPEELRKNNQKDIYIYTITNGYSKILTISDRSFDETLKLQREEEKQNTDYIPKQTINISLSAIGVSLIVKTYQDVRKEFAFMYFEGIKFIIIDTEDSRDIQLKINYTQIDNNISNKQLFPVTLYPKDLFKKRDLIKKAKDKKKPDSDLTPAKDFFNFLVVIKKNIPNVVFFDQINFLVQTIVLQMDDELIGYVFRFISNITDNMHTNITGVHEVFRAGQIGHGDDWMNYDQSIINQIRNNEENSLFQILEQNNEDSEEEDDVKSNRSAQKRQKLIEEDFLDQEFRRNTVNSVRDQQRRGVSFQQPQNRATDYSLQTKTRMSTSSSNNFSALHSQSWLNYKIDDKGKKLYIKEYRSSPIEIELSFISRGKMDIDSAEKQFSLFDKIRTFGLTLANVDKAPIRINSFISNNIFGTSEEIGNKLYNHYTERLKKNLFSVLGSSNILGNPTNFINHMGTGMNDFFYKPIEGLVQGPLEGGRGIIDGTSSLIKNTVQGTFGSASKMISSVSKGLLFITDDIDFINKREEENMDKPKNVIEGLGYGLKSTFTGIASGITGVIENPISGARKDGVAGFFKGTYKGVSGLVVKPISGALDFFSKTSEGIKNTASSDDKKVGKIRLVRPFYGKLQLIKVYDEFHALVVQHLQKMGRGAYSKDHFIDALHYASAKENFTLVLTNEHLLIVDTKTRDVSKQWESQNLNNVKKLGQNFIQVNVVDRFELAEKGRDEQVQTYEAFRLQIDDPKMFERFFKKLRYYIYKLQSENA